MQMVERFYTPRLYTFVTFYTAFIVIKHDPKDPFKNELLNFVHMLFLCLGGVGGYFCVCLFFFGGVIRVCFALIFCGVLEGFRG